MDGTKPAMESNAEETQDEGQESKGTQSAADICAFLCIFSLWRRSRLRQPERVHLYLQWLLALARHNSGFFFVGFFHLAFRLFEGDLKKKKNLSAADYPTNPERNLSCRFAPSEGFEGWWRRIRGLVGCGTVWFYGACINANLLLHCCNIAGLSLPKWASGKEAVCARLHCSGSGVESSAASWSSRRSRFDYYRRSSHGGSVSICQERD